MLGLGRELGTSGYAEPSVSMVWIMRPSCQVLVCLQCLFQFLDNKPMFMWYLAWKEVNTSTQESQVTLFSISVGMFLVACRVVSICFVFWVCCLWGGNCIRLGLFGERRGLFVRYVFFWASLAFANLVSALRLKMQVWNEVSIKIII